MLRQTNYRALAYYDTANQHSHFQHVLAIPETIGLGHLVSIGLGDVRRNQRRVGFLNN